MHKPGVFPSQRRPSWRSPQSEEPLSDSHVPCAVPCHAVCCPCRRRQDEVLSAFSDTRPTTAPPPARPWEGASLSYSNRTEQVRQRGDKGGQAHHHQQIPLSGLLGMMLCRPVHVCVLGAGRGTEGVGGGDGTPPG